MIALVIKGTPNEAREAMMARGIQWNDSFISLSANETLGRCGSENTEKVIKWFTETAKLTGSFEPGTLLFYSGLSKEEQRQ